MIYMYVACICFFLFFWNVGEISYWSSGVLVAFLLFWLKCSHAVTNMENTSFTVNLILFYSKLTTQGCFIFMFKSFFSFSLFCLYTYDLIDLLPVSINIQRSLSELSPSELWCLVESYFNLLTWFSFIFRLCYFLSGKLPSCNEFYLHGTGWLVANLCLQWMHMFLYWYSPAACDLLKLYSIS